VASIHHRLVRLGYGPLNEVREMGARSVLQALHYDDFLNAYEAAYMELNRDNS